MRTKKKDGDEAQEQTPPMPAPATTPEPKRLTPVEVQQKEFRLAVRGYNEREVDEFLDEVTEEMARLYAENTRLRAEVETRGGSVPEPSAATAAPVPVPSTPAALHAFVAREQEFLKQLAGLIQEHARAVKEARRRASGDDGPVIDLANAAPEEANGSGARPAVAFETTGAGTGDEDRSVRELFWGEE
jgi:DivIVA domain-containing protein